MYWQLSSYYLLDQLKMRESQDDVVSRLIIEGSYGLILTKIFINLDEQTIVDCGKVCHLWRQFLITSIRG